MGNNLEASGNNKNFFSKLCTEISEFYEEYKIQRPVTSKLVMLAIASVLLAIILLFVHKPIIFSEALSFDDNQYVFQNVLVKNPSWNSAKRFFSEVLNPSTVGGYYQPLAMVSLMVDVALGGSYNKIYVFHITSLCIHLLNSILVLLLLYLLFKKIWVAFAGGLLFGIHPVAVEEIVWISERKSVLATFFLLLALVLYVFYVKSSHKRYFVLSAIVFILALLSKPIAVSLPVIFILLDYFWFKRLKFLTLLEKIPFFAIAIIFTIIAYISQKNTAAVEVVSQNMNILQMFLLVCYNNIFYLWKLIVPTNLSCYYEFIYPISFTNPAYLIPAILTILLAVIFLLTWRRSKLLLLGYLFYIFSLLPTVGIFKVTESLACYKYGYFPFVGVLICVIILLNNISKTKISQVAKYSIVITIILSLSVWEILTSNIYSSEWKDTETLCKHILYINPQSPTALNTLGGEYYNQGKIDKAIEYFDKSLSIDPKKQSTLTNLASAYSSKEKYDEAISLYNKTIKSGVNPNSLALIYYNIGLIYELQGKHTEAKKMFEDSIKINPNFIDSSFELAITLSELGDFEEAFSICNKIIRDYPNTELAYTYLGILYSKTGNYKEAVKQVGIAIDKNPVESFSYYILGNILVNDNKHTEAAMCYDEAIKLEPSNVRIYNDYGKLFAQQAKFDEAINILKESISKLPTSDAYNTLGLVYEDTGKYTESLDSYQKAYEINPNTEGIEDSLNRVKEKIK